MCAKKMEETYVIVPSCGDFCVCRFGEHRAETYFSIMQQYLHYKAHILNECELAGHILKAKNHTDLEFWDAFLPVRDSEWPIATIWMENACRDFFHNNKSFQDFLLSLIEEDDTVQFLYYDKFFQDPFWGIVQPRGYKKNDMWEDMAEWSEGFLYFVRCASYARRTLIAPCSVVLSHLIVFFCIPVLCPFPSLPHLLLDAIRSHILKQRVEYQCVRTFICTLT